MDTNLSPCDGMLAQPEAGSDDDGDFEHDNLSSPDRPSRGMARTVGGSRQTSQSLPRYCMHQSTISNSSAGVGTTCGPRKVDSLPGSLGDRGPSTPERKKRSTAKLLRSFGHFVQKVARQLTSVTLHASGTNGVTNGGRSRTPTRQNGRSVGMPGENGDGEKLDHNWTSMPPGVVGIQNHGNTCFMNAVVQCLANTEPLARYLVTSRYCSDIRRSAGKTSGLWSGTRGELTESFANVVRAVWMRRITSEISNDFRAMVARHGAQYRGCTQHDAQEFLLWLLDRIHEDVNIATKKKYRPVKSNVGRPDEVIAAESLANHARCNNSFIYDLFQALYRSSLTCPSCRHCSNTFDPFLSLSLPIPHKSCQQVTITLLRADNATDPVEHRVQMAFLLEQDDTVHELRLAVADLAQISSESLLLIDIDTNGFRRTLDSASPISYISDMDDIYAVEVSQNSCKDLITAVVLHKESPTGLWFGPVMVVNIDRNSSLVQIKQSIRDVLIQFSADKSVPVADELLRLRVEEHVLSPNDDSPLQSDAINSIISRYPNGSGPPHLKMVAEWEKTAKESFSPNNADKVDEHESVHQAKVVHQQPTLCTLDECFQVYMQEERLGAEDAWLCPNCHKYQQDAVKALSLWSLPEILVIHLKRFKQDASQRFKLNTLVTFPVTGLDMSRHCHRKASSNMSNGVIHHSSSRSLGSSSAVSSWLTWRPGRKVLDSPDEHMYDLYAVCNHYGNMQGGHYTAFCKNLTNAHWYSFNDNHAAEMREEEVVTRAAYLLFYRRRSAATEGSSSPSRDWLDQLTNGNVSCSSVKTSSPEEADDSDKDVNIIPLNSPSEQTEDITQHNGFVQDGSLADSSHSDSLELENSVPSAEHETSSTESNHINDSRCLHNGSCETSEPKPNGDISRTQFCVSTCSDQPGSNGDSVKSGLNCEVTSDVKSVNSISDTSCSQVNVVR